MKPLDHFIASKVKALNGLVTRNGGRGLIGILLEYVRGVRPRASKSVVRQVASFVFASYRIAKHSKLKGLVIYLKACQVLLQQSVGGYRVLDLSDLKVRPKRTRSGLPRMIPSGARRLIVRDRDIPTIKLWMTLFGLFRVLEFKGKLSFDTILKPGSLAPEFLPGWDLFLKDVFCPNLSGLTSIPKIPNPSLFPILKSGPTGDGDISSSGYALIKAGRL